MCLERPCFHQAGVKGELDSRRGCPEGKRDGDRGANQPRTKERGAVVGFKAAGPRDEEGLSDEGQVSLTAL